LRQTYGELEKTHLRDMETEVPLLGGVFVPSKYQAFFPATGALIEAGHLDDKTALSRWLSTEYDDIIADEGSTFNPKFLMELSTRARSSKPMVQADGGARFSVGTNPGGPAWPTLLDFFVTHTPDFEKYRALKGKYKPEQWHYIKALLDDNPWRDPDYEDTLAVLEPERYEQLRWGAEYVIEGAFFRELRQQIDGQPHHERVVAVPKGTTWSCGMDWGFNAPGWCGWFAHLPDGHYHLARELKFQGKTAEQVAEQWHMITKELGIARVSYVACDPSMAAKTGHGKGESILDTLRRKRLPMRKSDNDRFNGWSRCHELFQSSANGVPFLTVDPGCRYWWRSVPQLTQDDNDPDDVDTTQDDHAADGTRYWAMSRPAPTRVQTSNDAPVGSLRWWREREASRAGVLS
jgi:hypothetical protein